MYSNHIEHDNTYEVKKKEPDKTDLKNAAKHTTTNSPKTVIKGLHENHSFPKQ